MAQKQGFEQNLTARQETAETGVSLVALAEKIEKATSSDCHPPAKIAEKAEAAGVTKSKLNALSTGLLGGMAGVFIGLGAMFCTLAITNINIGFGLTKLLGGLVFCLGLILVVIAGAELFTGNSLLTMSFISGRTSFARMARNWGLVYAANMVGSLALVGFMFYSNQWAFSDFGVGATALSIANAKVSLGFGEALVRGILCNFLVCLAVWMAFSARTVSGKILAIIFPITAFVAAGFEHSIANMYFIPMGMLMAHQPAVLGAAGLTAGSVANLNWAGFASNLIPVTIGNIIGGGVFIGAIYWFTYLRKDRTAEMVAARPWMKAFIPGFRRTETKAPAPLSDLVRTQLEDLVRTKMEEPDSLDTSGKALLEVLTKAKDDDCFMARLAENPTEALRGYALTSEGRAALASGDIRWIESKLGTLAEPLKSWLNARLAQEKW